MERERVSLHIVEMNVRVLRLLSTFTVLFVLLVATTGEYNCSELGPPRLSSMKFIGIGYNLLDGNPEGSGILGGLDPGFRATHRVLQLTYNTNRLTQDRSVSLPDQVNYTPRLGCAIFQTTIYIVHRN